MARAISLVYVLLAATATLAVPNPRPRANNSPNPNPNPNFVPTPAKPGIEVPGTTWDGPNTGAPSGTAPPSPQDCERAGVFACEHVLWSGKCEYWNNCIGGAPDLCSLVPDDIRVSSIGPDKGWKCIFYKTAFCQDVPEGSAGNLTLVWPGLDRLTEVKDASGVTWNDNIKSYHCFKNF